MICVVGCVDVHNRGFGVYTAWCARTDRVICVVEGVDADGAIHRRGDDCRRRRRLSTTRTSHRIARVGVVVLRDTHTRRTHAGAQNQRRRHARVPNFAIDARGNRITTAAGRYDDDGCVDDATRESVVHGEACDAKDERDARREVCGGGATIAHGGARGGG